MQLRLAILAAVRFDNPYYNNASNSIITIQQTAIEEVIEWKIKQIPKLTIYLL